LSYAPFCGWSSRPWDPPIGLRVNGLRRQPGKRPAGTARFGGLPIPRRIYHRRLQGYQRRRPVKHSTGTISACSTRRICYERRCRLYGAGANRTSEIPVLGRRDGISVAVTGGWRSRVPRTGASTPFASESETKRSSTHKSSINFRCPGVSTCMGRT